MFDGVPVLSDAVLVTGVKRATSTSSDELEGKLRDVVILSCLSQT